MPPDILEKVNAHFQKEQERKGQKYRRYVNSASSLGDPCTRKLIYYRVRPEDQRAPNAHLQRIFAYGDEIERYVLNVMSDAGIKVIHTQITTRWERFNITGHPDGEIVADDGELIPFDIKGLNRFTWAKLNTPGDFEDQGWTSKYLAQMVIYLWSLERKRGAFVLFNKDTAEWKIIYVDLDDWIELMESLLQKADLIEKHIRLYQSNQDDCPEETLPEKLNQRSECSRCPYEHICCPEIEYGPGVEIIESAGAVDMMIRREQRIEAKREYDQIQKEIRETFVLPPEVDKHEWFVSNGNGDDFIVAAKRGTDDVVRRTISRPEI